MPEIEAGKTYNPLAIVSNADEALAYRSAQGRTAEQNQEIARRLFADLSRASEQAGEDGDFSRVTGFGDNPAERVMQIHSQLAGVERAIFEEVRAEAERQQQESAILRNVGGHRVDGNGRPVRPQSTMTPAQRFFAAVSEQNLELSSLARSNWEFTEDFLGQETGLASEQIRQALFGTMGVRAARFDTGDWDPWFNREPGYVPSIVRPVQVIDMIPMGVTNTDTVAWMEETAHTPGAQPVNEGELLKEATYTLAQRTTPVQRIGHRIPVTENVLNDVGQTASYLNMVMPFGVMQKLDDQIINGDGSAIAAVTGPPASGAGQNLLGILHNTGILSRDWTPVAAGNKSAKEPLHDIKRALTAYRIHNQSFGSAMGSLPAIPTHVLIYPSMWEKVCLAETTAGGFYLGSPANSFEPRLWGVPIVETTLLKDDSAAGNVSAVVVDFTGMWITLYMREGLSTQMGLMNDQFGRYMVTIRSGIRCALAIRRGAAFMRIKRAA